MNVFWNKTYFYGVKRTFYVAIMALWGILENKMDNKVPTAVFLTSKVKKRLCGALIKISENH